MGINNITIHFYLVKLDLWGSTEVVVVNLAAIWHSLIAQI